MSGKINKYVVLKADFNCKCLSVYFTKCSFYQSLLYTILRVSLVCLFVSLKTALCWIVFWAGKPKVGCCASGSGNQSCYVKVAFGPRLRLHPNVRWNAQKSAIYRSRWRSSVWSRESPRTPPRTPPTHHPMHLNLGTALVIFNTKLFFIIIIKLLA